MKKHFTTNTGNKLALLSCPQLRCEHAGGGHKQLSTHEQLLIRVSSVGKFFVACVTACPTSWLVLFWSRPMPEETDTCIVKVASLHLKRGNTYLFARCLALSSSVIANGGDSELPFSTWAGFSGFKTSNFAASACVRVCGFERASVAKLAEICTLFITEGYHTLCSKCTT